jgi:PHP family Zn ribbon phosphoesterase
MLCETIVTGNLELSRLKAAKYIN